MEKLKPSGFYITLSETLGEYTLETADEQIEPSDDQSTSAPTSRSYLQQVSGTKTRLFKPRPEWQYWITGSLSIEVEKMADT